MSVPVIDPIERMAVLGRAGFVVSVCCGPCGHEVFRWTVQVMSPTGQEFDEPFAATSFQHAIEIAYLEVLKRGWV